MGSFLKKKLKDLQGQIEQLKENFRLPELFCNTCTLKEGTIVVVVATQFVAAVFVAIMASLLLVIPDEADKWWEQRFKDDFDPYINGENQHIIGTLHPLWRPVSTLLAGVEAAYFGTGLIANYALVNKNAHPACYLPWLVFTALLVTCNFLTVVGMIVYTCYVSMYRELTVTGDLVPSLLCFFYAGLWGYGFITVLAHYKRRVIVRWWRDQELKERKQRI